MSSFRYQKACASRVSAENLAHGTVAFVGYRRNFYSAVLPSTICCDVLPENSKFMESWLSEYKRGISVCVNTKFQLKYIRIKPIKIESRQKSLWKNGFVDSPRSSHPYDGIVPGHRPWTLEI